MKILLVVGAGVLLLIVGFLLFARHSKSLLAEEHPVLRDDFERDSLPDAGIDDRRRAGKLKQCAKPRGFAFGKRVITHLQPCRVACDWTHNLAGTANLWGHPEP